MVVVNLYAFEKVAARKDAPVQELIENIDIGGPTMIRAAAKNYQDVAVVVSPGRIHGAAGGNAGERRASFRRRRIWRLAQKAFALTAAYDRAITARLASSNSVTRASRIRRRRAARRCSISRAERTIALRYGENPHQQAALYSRQQRRNCVGASSFTARNFPTTIWWIWMRRGS